MSKFLNYNFHVQTKMKALKKTWISVTVTVKSTINFYKTITTLEIPQIYQWFYPATVRYKTETYS